MELTQEHKFSCPAQILAKIPTSTNESETVLPSDVQMKDRIRYLKRKLYASDPRSLVRLQNRAITSFGPLILRDQPQSWTLKKISP